MHCRDHGAIGVKKKFQKMLILVFEVINHGTTQNTFLTFSSETKIMKITQFLLGGQTWATASITAAAGPHNSNERQY